jgi:dienelactone hydrolase
MRVYTGIPEGTQRRAGLLVAQHGAGHAFQNFLDASRYRERPARGTWSEMLAFFAQHLKA